MSIYFLILFLQIFLIILSIKTEIKFNLNVPSLFRCRKNGPVFYFEKFPTDQLFLQTIKNMTRDCDLSLMSTETRVTFEVKKHEIQCERAFFKFEQRVNEILFFKSNCSINIQNDRCVSLTPTIATIMRDNMKDPERPISMDLRIIGIGTENVQIGDENQNLYPYSWTNDGYQKKGARRYQIVFKMKYDGYLNMMCQYTYINHPKDSNPGCKFRSISFTSIQTRSGTATSTEDGWSWLCYYYPSGVEQPLDYRMISKARDDLEKATSSKRLTLSLLPFSNVTDFSYTSPIPLNETTKSSSTSIFTLLLVFIIAGGIFCVYKQKCQVKSNESDFTRSSLESENSTTSNESIENEDN